MARRFGLLFQKSKPESGSSSSQYIFEYELNNFKEKDRHGSSLQFTSYKCTTENQSIKDSQPSFDFSSAFHYDVTDTFSEAKHDPQYKTIFTYSEPFEQDVSHTPKMDYGFRRLYKENDIGLNSVVIFLSTVLLFVFLPILCWIFIKKLSQNERIIVIRLGHRLSPKGPGWVVILPFCDSYHRVNLDEQTIKLKDVSGGTKDEALLELTASINFRLVDVEMAFALTTQSPSQLVTGQAQLCLLSSISKLMWRNQLANGAYQDLELETMTSLSCRCGHHGIQIIGVSIDEVNLVRDASSIDTLGKRQVSMIGQHLRALSVLIQSNTIDPLAHTAAALSETLSSNEIARERSSTSTVGSMVSNIPSLSSGDDVSQSECSGQQKISADVMRVRKSICLNAIARAQPFLRNSAACRALDYASLQLKVYATRQESQENAISADDPEEVYFDAGSNRSEMGTLPGDKPPSVTLHIGYEELREVLSGRLDLMYALNNGLCRVVGDRMVLSKMRYLLFLQR